MVSIIKLMAIDSVYVACRLSFMPSELACRCAISLQHSGSWSQFLTSQHGYNITTPDPDCPSAKLSRPVTKFYLNPEITNFWISNCAGIKVFWHCILWLLMSIIRLNLKWPTLIFCTLQKQNCYFNITPLLSWLQNLKVAIACLWGTNKTIILYVL